MLACQPPPHRHSWHDEAETPGPAALRVPGGISGSASRAPGPHSWLLWRTRRPGMWPGARPSPEARCLPPCSAAGPRRLRLPAAQVRVRVRVACMQLPYPARALVRAACSGLRRGFWLGCGFLRRSSHTLRNAAHAVNRASPASLALFALALPHALWTLRFMTAQTCTDDSARDSLPTHSFLWNCGGLKITAARGC